MKRQIDDGPTSRDLGGLFRVGIGGQLPQDARRQRRKVLIEMPQA